MSQAVELPLATDTGPPEDDLLRMEGVDAFYGHIQALRGVSLRVGRGEIVTLIGSNGAGKTTTLKTVSGLVRARKGQVVFDNEDISRVDAYRLVRRGIGRASCRERVCLVV